mgnify:CR=1 FL=1
MSGKRKFAASLCALAFAVSAAAGGAYAWLSTGDSVSAFRVGFAQVSAVCTIDGETAFLRSEGSATQTAVQIEKGSHAFAVENKGAAATAAIKVSADDALAAKTAGATLEIGGKTAYICDFTQETGEVTISLGEYAAGDSGEYTLTLTTETEYVLPLTVEITAR